MSQPPRGPPPPPSSPQSPKILLLNIELELKSEKENAEVRLDDPAKYQSIVDAGGWARGAGRAAARAMDAPGHPAEHASSAGLCGLVGWLATPCLQPAFLGALLQRRTRPRRGAAGRPQRTCGCTLFLHPHPILHTHTHTHAPWTAEWNIIYDKLAKCAESGAKIVLSRYAIGDLATQYFADRDIFCAGRVNTPACPLGSLDGPGQAAGPRLHPACCYEATLGAARSAGSSRPAQRSRASPALRRLPRQRPHWRSLLLASPCGPRVPLPPLPGHTGVPCPAEALHPSAFQRRTPPNPTPSCLAQVPEEDLQRVAEATGGQIQTTVNNLSPAKALGTCQRFEERQVGAERYNLFTGAPYRAADRVVPPLGRAGRDEARAGAASRLATPLA